MCEELDRSCCGNLLFFCQLFPPVFDPLTLGATPPISVTQLQLTPGAKTGQLTVDYRQVWQFSSNLKLIMLLHRNGGGWLTYNFMLTGCLGSKMCRFEYSALWLCILLYVHSLYSRKHARTDFSRQVLQIIGHGNSLAVAYNHCVCVLTVRESRGWEVVFTTPTLERVPQRIALNTRVAGGQGGPILAAVVGKTQFY